MSLDELRHLAQSVLDKFPVVSETVRAPKRPFFIELSGTPKAGKTSAAENLEAFLRRCHFQVRVLTERATINPLRNKNQPSFNTWNTVSLIADMIQALDGDDQVVIVDRGLFDCLSWFQWNRMRGKVADDEAALMSQFVQFERWWRLTDLLLVLHSKPEDAMSREPMKELLQGGDSDEDSVRASVMTIPVLTQFNSALKREFDEVSHDVGIAHWIDIDNQKEDDVALLLISKVLKALDRFLDEQIVVFPTEQFRSLDVFSGFFDDPGLLRRFVQIVRDHSKPIIRRIAEADYLGLVQPIPLAYFTHEGEYLLLRRQEQERDNYMHDKYVIWAGGHPRPGDEEDGDLLEGCLLREIAEELQLKGPITPEFMGLVHDAEKTKYVSHVGVVYRIAVEDPDIALALGQGEFKESRGQGASCKFVGVDELKKHFEKMDRWSKRIITQHLKLFGRELSTQRLLF